MPNQSLAANSNLPGGATYNYQTQLPGTSPRREDLLRLDYNLTEKIRVFGHYIKDISNAGIPYGTWVLGINPPIAPISEPIPGNSLAGGMTFMITPTMTNEFNLGYTNNSINIFAPNNGLGQSLLGSTPLPVLYPDANQGYLPQVGFGGNNLANSPTFGSSDAPFINYNTTIDLTDSLTKVWRSHIIKAGYYMQRSRKDQTSFGAFKAATISATRAVRRVRIRSIPATGSPMRCWAFISPSTRRSITLTACTVTGTSNNMFKIPGRLLLA